MDCQMVIIEVEVVKLTAAISPEKLCTRPMVHIVIPPYI